MVVAMGSCEKQDNKADLGIDALKAAKVTYAPGDMPGPTSHNGIIPVIIPGDNKGGNRTCEEVWIEFGEEGEVCGVDYLCGDKVDYDGDGAGFASSFPDGLTVTVLDGIHIEFEIDGCLEFVGVPGDWKVGAVIVKGSNAANIYWYPDGETHDWGLAAPGDKHMVSNLTFCFVPCEFEEPENVIAVKAFYFISGSSGETTRALSVGREVFDPGWCASLGLNDYPNPDPDPIALGTVGTVTVAANGDVIVALTDENMILDKTCVYVGPEAGLDVTDCPEYEDAPWVVDDTNANSVTIPIN